VKLVLGIIPARYASSRFPGKPLALIQNKPMIQWVFEKASSVFEYLYVATDDERIKKEVEKFGGKVVMTSPDHGSGTERCREASDILSSKLSLKFTHVVNIQGDEPLIKMEQINELMSCFDLAETDIATLIQPFDKEENIADPNMVKAVVDNKLKALYFSRAVIPYIRSASPELWMQNNTYYKHIGLYAYTTKALQEITQLSSSPLEMAESLEQLRWLENGYRIQTRISNYQAIGIDTPDDLENLKRKLAL